MVSESWFRMEDSTPAMTSVARMCLGVTAKFRPFFNSVVSSFVSLLSERFNTKLVISNWWVGEEFSMWFEQPHGKLHKDKFPCGLNNHMESCLFRRNLYFWQTSRITLLIISCNLELLFSDIMDLIWSLVYLISTSVYFFASWIKRIFSNKTAIRLLCGLSCSMCAHRCSHSQILRDDRVLDAANEESEVVGKPCQFLQTVFVSTK